MNKIIKVTSCVVAMVVGITAYCHAAHFELQSPNGRLQMSISNDTRLVYSLSMDGNEVVATSPIGMLMNDGRIWNGAAPIVDVAKRSHDANVYKREEKRVTSAHKLNIKTEQGGGFVMILRKSK